MSRSGGGGRGRANRDEAGHRDGGRHRAPTGSVLDPEHQPAAPSGASGLLRATVTVLLVVAAVLVAVIAGLVAMLATAAVIAVPAVFVGVGIAVFLVVNLGGAALVARRAQPGRRRRVRPMLFATSSAVILALFVGTALVPADASVPPPLPGSRQVEVSTGSSLTVLHLPARGPTPRTPIVVLHGGPGVPDLAANSAAFAPLTEQGWDVYLYAQVGAGHSTRLDNPRGYAPDRDVVDLDALLEQLGLDRVTLVAHSYGAEVAARYAGYRPGRVLSMVLLSPAPLDPADHSGERATAGLDEAQRLRLYTTLLAPRSLLGYALLQVNPSAAHAFLPDAEADARNDGVVGLAQPALHCPGAAAGEPVSGTGFYAMQSPQSATAPEPGDPRPAIAGLDTPTLVVKGSCDYLSWSSAVDYTRALPQSRLLYLPAAGHNVQHDQAETVRQVVAAFLEGRPLPVAPVEGDRVPPDYAGPP